MEKTIDDPTRGGVQKKETSPEQQKKANDKLLKDETKRLEKERKEKEKQAKKDAKERDRLDAQVRKSEEAAEKSASKEEKAAEINKTKAVTEAAFVSLFPDYHFNIPILDEHGEKVYHSDANGNNKLPSFKEFTFKKVPFRDKVTGKIDMKKTVSAFVTSVADHGKDFERILHRLNKLRQNPKNKLYTERQHFENTNPQAFSISEASAAKDLVIDAQAAKIKELEDKLGVTL